MSDEEHPVDPLDQIIADYLSAEEAGTALDRDELLREHPEHAADLALFFADHDGMRQVRGGLPQDAVAGPNSTPDSARSLPDAKSPRRDTDREQVTIEFRPSGVPSPVEQLRLFGDFELLEEIARGGMGIVYRARQRSLNRIVALKMILAGQLASAEDVQRFRKEAEAAANLEHSNIVPIYEVGERSGHHYYAMAYIDGHSLATRLEDGPVPPREAARCVKVLAGAIAYAHRRGVIHRDLKPSNVLLDRSGEPKIMDFGLAKLIDSGDALTVTGQIVGTPSYMAPEQASGNIREVREQADIYSLGAVLYAMLTGEPPFRGENRVETLLQVLHQDPRPARAINPRIPRDLDTICMKCLEKDPSHRYASAAELSADLGRFLIGEPVHARPVSIRRRVKRWARREPGVAATWCAVSFFYIYHLVCYRVLRLPGETPEFHNAATALCASWCLGAAIFQRRLRGSKRVTFLYLWATWDVMLLTMFLFIADSARSPLALVYQVLVASSVVRGRTDLVGYVTGLTIACYTLHVAYTCLLLPGAALQFNEAFPFALSLAVIGLIQYLALKHAELVQSVT
jgi:serine/threonine-protein kinase